MDLRAALYVVDSTSAGNGIGGTSVTNYTYAGLRASLDGRGLLGFAQTTATAVMGSPYTENMKTITTYRQEFPFTGLPCKVERQRVNATTGTAVASLGTTLNTFGLWQTSGTGTPVEPALPGGWSACASAQSAWYQATQDAGTTRHFFPYVNQNDERLNEVTGAFVNRVCTRNTFDQYGNAAVVDVAHLASNGTCPALPAPVTGGTGYNKTTINTYAPDDPVKWFLGRLIKSTVTSTQ